MKRSTFGATFITCLIAGCLAGEAIDSTSLAQNEGGGSSCDVHCASEVTIPTSAAPWGIGPDVFTYNGIDDHILKLGYNVSAEAAVVDWSEPSLALQWESHFKPSPTAPAYMEWHLQYQRHLPDGNGGWTTIVRRPITTTVDRDTHAVGAGLRGRIEYHNSEVTQMRMKLDDGPSGANVAQHMYHTTLQWETPNETIIRSHNGSNYTEVVRVKTSPQPTVVLGHIGSPVQVSGNFAANNKEPAPPPTVTTCDELITALDQMGLVVDGR